MPAEVLESLGVEHNNQWLFRQADGTILERWTGSVVIGVAGKRAADEVVFGMPGDLVLLGSRTLEGLNFGTLSGSIWSPPRSNAPPAHRAQPGTASGEGLPACREVPHGAPVGHHI